VSNSAGSARTNVMDRLADLIQFYELLDRLEDNLGGKRRLADCDGRMGWPGRGVYFFFEPSEERSDTGRAPRVVRVGTHALKPGSGTTIWKRLSRHKGIARSGGGNHRGSIFRLLVGTAIKKRDRLDTIPSWGVGSDSRKAAEGLALDHRQVRIMEQPLELTVSKYIRLMPFLWLEIDDPPGPESGRGYIERNSIGLLSNYGPEEIDPPSTQWLGRYCDRERVRRSGLWNNNHVNEHYDPNFLVALQRKIAAMKLDGTPMIAP